MPQAIAPSPPVFTTLADVLSSAGDVPPHRVWICPLPGEATEADVIRIHDQQNRLCGLVNGVLVEKTAGAFESYLAALLTIRMGQFVEEHDLGILLGTEGMLRLASGLVPIPNVSFVSWAQLPGRVFPSAAIPDLHPELAIEVLRRNNTRREMDHKLRDYFDAGAKLVWYLDPQARQMHVYRSETDIHVVGIDGTLDGGNVLPGFTLPLAKLFEIAPPPSE